jgi:hypothetical protein
MKKQRVILTELRQLLTERVDIEELRTLIFDLEVDYDNLRGEGKAGKVRELIRYLKVRDRIPELIEVARQNCPDVADWDDFQKRVEEASKAKTPPWVSLAPIKPGNIIAAAMIGIILVAVAAVVIGSRRFPPGILKDSPPTLTPTPTPPIIGEVVIEVDGRIVTGDEDCQEVVCNSYPRIEVDVLDPAGVKIQPDVFSYNWHFHPGDPHNEDKLDSKNYAINYHVPCERESQTIAVEVLKNGEQMCVRNVCFNIKKQP